MASIKDVAKRAGVSISTVSNVLNGTKYVSETLKKQVNIAAQELNYEADPIARNMKIKQTKTIGVITADMCGLFYPYVVKGIYERLSNFGYNVMICDTNGVNDSAGSMERERQNFKKLISSRVDGIIFATTVIDPMAKYHFEQVKKMAKTHKNIPLVAIEHNLSQYGIDSVSSNYFEGAKLATKHLIECGCKNIGHVTGPIYSPIALDRLEGYMIALTEANLQVDAIRNVANGVYTHQSGYSGMKELLEKMPNLDGVFLANDQMACGALKALSELGKKVPEEIKVIGYDDVFISSIIEPSLSTVHTRKKHIGIEAAKILLDKIDNPETDRAVISVELENKLVIRKSTDSKAASDWILSDW
jgi:DNA-binding LacI/PurR family transcriptional regulator